MPKLRDVNKSKKKKKKKKKEAVHSVFTGVKSIRKRRAKYDKVMEDLGI